MTFDARQTSPETGKSNLVFGVLTVLAVGGAFGLVLALPHGDKATQMAPEEDVPAVRQIAAVTDPVLPLTHAPIIVDEPEADVPVLSPSPATALEHLPEDGGDMFGDSKAAKAYFKALRRFDPEARAQLDSALVNASAAPADRKAEIVLAHALSLLDRHGEALAHADTRHVDNLLDLTRARLKKAARKESPWCDGARYSSLSQSNLAGGDAMAAELRELETPLRDYTFEAMTRLLVAAADGKRRPVEHGEMTPLDEAAVQGVMMSIISDPQIMPLLLATQTGKDPEDALAEINVCDLGATAVVAIKTLPQDTKGRVFAALVRDRQGAAENFSLLSDPAGY